MSKETPPPIVGQEVYYEICGIGYLGICTDIRGPVILENSGSVIVLPEYVEIDGEIQLHPSRVECNDE